MQKIDVEMRGVCRGFGRLGRRAEDHPVEKVPTLLVVLKGEVAEQGAGYHPGQHDEELAKRAVTIAHAAQDVTDHFTRLLVDRHEGAFRLVVGVVGREEIREQLPVGKDGVDRITPVAGVAADAPHGLPIFRFVGPNRARHGS